MAFISGDNITHVNQGKIKTRNRKTGKTVSTNRKTGKKYYSKADGTRTTKSGVKWNQRKNAPKRERATNPAALARVLHGLLSPTTDEHMRQGYDDVQNIRGFFVDPNSETGYSYSNGVGGVRVGLEPQHRYNRMITPYDGLMSFGQFQLEGPRLQQMVPTYIPPQDHPSINNTNYDLARGYQSAGMVPSQDTPGAWVNPEYDPFQ